MVEHAVQGGERGSRIAIPVARERQVGANHAPGLETELDMLPVRERLHHQCGACAQDHGACDLHRDQNGTQAGARGPGRFPPAAPQHRLRERRGRSQRGHDAAEDAGQHRQRRRKAEHSQVQGRIDDVREPAEDPRETDAPQRQQHANGAAPQREQHAFREQRGRELAAGRSERESHGHFVAAPDSAGQEDVGDVGARDQQHEPYGSLKEDEGPARIAPVHARKCHRVRNPVPVGRGMIERETPADPGHFGRCGVE